MKSIVPKRMVSGLLTCFALGVISSCDAPTVPTVPSTPNASLSEGTIDKKSSSELTGVIIPRSVAGDRGKYFLLDSEENDGIISSTHKRVGLDSIGYTKTETNCRTMKMREIGYSEVSASDITSNPTKWFDLVDGSSKSDLAKFVCSKK